MKRTGDGQESLGKEWLVCWYAGVLVGVIIDMDRDFLPAAQDDHGQKAILSCQLYTHHRSGEYYTLNIPNLLNPVNTHAKGVS